MKLDKLPYSFLVLGGFPRGQTFAMTFTTVENVKTSDTDFTIANIQYGKFGALLYHLYSGADLQISEGNSHHSCANDL